MICFTSFLNNFVPHFLPNTIMSACKICVSSFSVMIFKFLSIFKKAINVIQIDRTVGYFFYKSNLKNFIFVLLIFLFTSVQSFATYQIIETNTQSKEYQEFVQNITPETLGLRPTTDKAEYSEEKLIDYSPKGYLVSNDKENNYINQNKDSNDNLIAKVLGILIFGFILGFIQLFWWFFSEYVPKLQKDDNLKEK